jgi:hypothetical protein
MAIEFSLKNSSKKKAKEFFYDELNSPDGKENRSFQLNLSRCFFLLTNKNLDSKCRKQLANFINSRDYNELRKSIETLNK